MLTNAQVPVLGFAAVSGTGKTTLLRALVPLLRDARLALGVVKHAHHTFDVDLPGKDSYELRHAGAPRVLVASRKRWALMVERDGEDEPTLDEVLDDLDQRGLDLVLVEGFKHERFPKIELHRPSLGRAPLFTGDAAIIAIATDAPLRDGCPLPTLDLNDPPAVARFVIAWAAGRDAAASRAATTARTGSGT